MAKFRVTNGQRAAVCGLILAGVPMDKGCAIAGVPIKQMRDVMAPGWRGRQVHTPRWRGEKLEQLREAYSELKLSFEAITEQFGISRDMTMYLARQHGWPRRRPRFGRKPLPVPVSKMQRDQRNRYRYLQRIIGREAAVQAVFG
jgi:hypothetical protein